MNVRKTVIVAGGSVVILLLLGIRLGWFGKLKAQSPPVENKVKTVRKVSSPKPAPVPKVAAAPEKKESSRQAPPAPRQAPPAPRKGGSAPEQDLGLGDPFSYASSSATGDYTPLSGNRSVGSITVKGIICMAGEEPKAILHLKESDRVHYVTRNSVVRVSTGKKKGTTPSEAYIVVKEIRDDEVELIQLERPDRVIIVR